MNVIIVLPCSALFCLFFSAQAVGEECYVIGGFGIGSIANIPTTNAKKLLAKKYTTGTYEVSGKSRPGQVGLGCLLGDSPFRGEVSRWSGFKAGVRTRGVLSTPHTTPQAFTVVEGADVSAVSAMLSWESSSLRGFALTVGVGVLRGEESFSRVSSESGNDVGGKKSGVLPAVSVGLLWRGGKDFTARMGCYQFGPNATVCLPSFQVQSVF